MGPIIVYSMMVFVQIVFTFSINRWYIVQLMTDFFGYSVLLIQALYAVQFRKFLDQKAKQEKKNKCCRAFGKLCNGQKKNGSSQTIIGDKNFAVYDFYCTYWSPKFFFV